ncbi:MAG: hypothetical protein LBN24_00395 [Mediterranea sp.]|jgi:hypothetical protein|nr:hypothetical protein [Mediterranea sp.]
MDFNTLIDIYRKEAPSEREKDARFERLLQRLLTESCYAARASLVDVVQSGGQTERKAVRYSVQVAVPRWR